MTKKILAILFALYPMLGFSEQVVINISAKVVGRTCSILNEKIQVTMPVESIRGKEINNAFGKTPFAISINDCGSDVSFLHIKFNATPDLSNPKLISNVVGEEYATGVALGLYRDNQLIDINSDVINYTINHLLSTNEIDFEVAYIKTNNETTVGKVRGVINFEITYD